MFPFIHVFRQYVKEKVVYLSVDRVLGLAFVTTSRSGFLAEPPAHIEKDGLDGHYDKSASFEPYSRNPNEAD